jgi:iron(III) transport system ATP-binding protein
MNFIAGRLLAANAAECQGAVLALDEDLACAPGTPLTICLRPEDVVVRDPASASNPFDVEVGPLAFMGDHVSTSMRIAGSGLAFSAQLSMNDIRDLGIRQGARIKAALPAARLRVFASAAA